MLSKNEFDKLAFQISASTDMAAIARAYTSYMRSAKQIPGLDATEFIRSTAPPSGYVLISDIDAALPFSVDGSYSRLCSFFRKRKFTVTDSICGFATPPEALSSLNEFLSSTVAIRPLYEHLCKTHNVPINQTEYAQLLRILGKYVIKERYNPCSLTTEYLTSSEPEATRIILSALSSVTQQEFPDTDLFTQESAAKYLGISEKAFMKWLKTQSNANQVLISEDFLKNIISAQSACVEINSQLVSEIFSDLEADILKLVAKHFRQWLKGNNYTLSEGSLPCQKKGVMYAKDLTTVKCASAIFQSTSEFIPLRKLSEASGIPLRSIMDSLCTEDNRHSLCLSIEAYRQHLNCLSEFCPLDEIVRTIVDEENSSFKITQRSNRQALLEFCANYNWWNLKHQSSHGTLLFSSFEILVQRKDINVMSSHIRLFLKLYGLDGPEKLESLIRANANLFPSTSRMLKDSFKSQEDLPSSAWQMVDLLFSYLHESGNKEINDLSRSEMEGLLFSFKRNCPLIICDLFSAFLCQNGIFSEAVTFARSGYKRNNSAYSFLDYAVIVYYSCNFTAWKEASLIQKAVNNKEFADLWLYVACHCYSAIRDTDYERLDAPELFQSPIDTLELFRAINLQSIDEYSEVLSDAKKVTGSFLSKIEFRDLKPNKTSSHQGVSQINFFVPESNYDSFGIILSIAAAHHYLEGGSSFIIPTTSKSLCLEFFGEHFVEACGNKPFYGIRAAKSLMQAVELEARDSGQAPPYIAYTLASAMRSHKGGYGQLAESTQYYLRDANFSGLTPEFVAKEMLERGVCSFIIDHILEKCFGDKYKHLSVHFKTEVIKATNMDAYQINNLRKSALSVQNDVITQINRWVDSPDDAYHFFDNLLMLRAQGKTSSCYCACIATDRKCAFNTRQHCYGCPYEIRSKASFIHYCKEYIRLKEANNAPFISELEKKKNLYIQKNLLEPAITEIVDHLSAEDRVLYLDLLKKLI